MKKQISKMLAFVCVLCASIVMFACGAKKDVNIKSIEVIESTVPEVVVIGKFDEAGIKALVSYEDDTTAEIDITSSMIPNEYKDLLNKTGIYKITISYRNETCELTVRMVNSTNIYQVNFYNAKNQIIKSEFVYDGEDATLPTENMYKVDGCSLIGWDVSNENITKDTNIYGIYVAVENTLTEEAMKNALINAEKYHFENNHFTSIESNSYDDGEISSTANTKNNYHYDKATEIGTSQQVYESDYYYAVYEYGATSYKLLEKETDGSETLISQTYEELKAEMEASGEEAEDIENFDQMLKLAKVYGEGMATVSYLLENGVNSFSYVLTANKIIYTFSSTETIYDEDGTTAMYIEKYTFVYDDEKLLQIKYCEYEADGETLGIENNFYIDYSLVEFDYLLIPVYGDVNHDGEINTVDGAMITRYLSGEIKLTASQLKLADVNFDEKVDATDSYLIQKYATKKISELPFTKMFGDVNFDEVVDTSDIVLINQHIAETTLLTADALVVADVNIDGNIDEIDVNILRKYNSSGWGIESLPCSFIFGDVNLDGEVTTHDVTTLRNYIDGEETLTGLALVCADVNMDGAVDESDYDLLVEQIGA